MHNASVTLITTNRTVHTADDKLLTEDSTLHTKDSKLQTLEETNQEQAFILSKVKQSKVLPEMESAHNICNTIILSLILISSQLDAVSDRAILIHQTLGW